MPNSQLKPTVFIGSSSKSVGIAKAVETLLRPIATCHVWTNGVFSLSQNTLADLLIISSVCDLGIFVFAPDDEVVKGGRSVTTTRDNVLFECGMFYGSAGPSRTFFLLPKDAPDFHVPSDLLGVTAAYYSLGGGAAKKGTKSPARGSKSGSFTLKKALEPACKAIESAIRSKTIGLSHRRLQGQWMQEWEVNSPNFPGVNRSIADVIVIGDTLVATYVAGKQRYRLRGRIQGDRIITGTYSESQLRSGYHGSFQLEICPTGKTMRGCWLGWSSSGGVKCGSWNWSKK